MSNQNKTFHSLFLCYPATFGKKKRESEFFFFRQKLRDSINISYEKFRFYPTSLTPQNADSPLPPVRQHQQGGSKKNFFFAKSSGISKNSSMRIFVVLRPNLISQSTAWGIRARTKQALFQKRGEVIWKVHMVRKGGQLKVHARSTWGEGGSKKAKKWSTWFVYAPFEQMLPLIR